MGRSRRRTGARGRILRQERKQRQRIRKIQHRSPKAGRTVPPKAAVQSRQRKRVQARCLRKHQLALHRSQRASLIRLLESGRKMIRKKIEKRTSIKTRRRRRNVPETARGQRGRTSRKSRTTQGASIAAGRVQIAITRR